MAQSLTPHTPDTDAYRSADIVVGATPVTIFMYTADGTFPSNFQAFIQRKVGSNYQNCFGPEEDTRLVLGRRRLEWTAYAPGTYAVVKGVTAYPIGVGTDS